MYIPLRPSAQLWTNQKAVPGARAQVECGSFLKYKISHNSRRHDFLCLFT